MEEHLSRSLGVRFATRPDGKAREVLGIRPEAMELFSPCQRQPNLDPLSAVEF